MEKREDSPQQIVADESQAASKDSSQKSQRDQLGPRTPSKAYALASTSPVYRLSEQMFSSLLASYVLGFIGFLAAHSDQPLDRILVLSIVYTSISISYAYLTASFYLTYHAGILTMPSMPVNRLGLDFFLALLQAMFFGFSMVFPKAFPILTGLLIVTTINRQSSEFTHLVRDIKEQIPAKPDYGHGPPDRNQEFRNLKRRINRLLDKSDYSELSGWNPVKTTMKTCSWILVAVGTIVWYAVDLRQLPGRLQLPGTWQLPEWSVAVASGIVALVICLIGRKTLKSRAIFFYDREKQTSRMNEQFDLLKEELQKNEHSNP